MAAAKAKVHPLNGMHTAGIFADPTVDGPLIGTLVAIVDRAKNLPNRKTIGKQDPYCAARLGKEAKRTTTDVRGGQTPKWDQELRFEVHDSPDYYQLKVSVFHDDKKTDLIGETWIDLRDIIVPGGGQNDLWRNLAFKGKYAGEVRMEITYYDTRPKPEKPVPRPKPVEADLPEAPVPQHGTIPRKQIKRRPLPSDPFTGEAPVVPSPEQTPTPPRAAGPRGPKEMGSSTPPAPEPGLSGSRPMPTRKPHPSYVPTQSPLQAIEYNATPAAPAPAQAPVPAPAPAPRGSQPELPAQSPQAALPQPAEVTPQHTPARHERYESPSAPSDERDYSPRYPSSQDIVDRAHYRQGSEPPPRDLYLEDQRHAPSVEDDRPPPPPAHRSRHNSGNSQDMVVRGNYDTPPKSANAMRQDVLRNEAHRMSYSSAYPGRPTYRGFDSAPVLTNALPAPDDHYHESPPRHHSYDGHAEQRSMQPTVEDVPESPIPAKANARRTSRMPPGQPQPQHDELGFNQEQSPAPPQSMEIAHRQTPRTPQRQDTAPERDFDQVPTPAPLNIGGRGSAGSRQRGQSPQPGYSRGDDMASAGHYSTSPRPDYQPRGDELVFAGRGSVSPGYYSTSPQPDYQQEYPPQQQEYQPRGDELVLAGRGNASPAHYNTPPQHAYPRGDEMVRRHQVSPIATRDLRGDEMVRHQQVSPIASRDFAPSPGDTSPYYPRSQNQYVSQRSELSGTEIQAVGGVPAVPASLVPGVDPSLAQEVSDRIHDDRRQQQRRYTGQNATTPTRGRGHSEPIGYADQTYVPPNYDHRPSAYGGPGSQGNRGRGVSPNPYQDTRGRGVSPNPYQDTRGRGVSPNPYHDIRGRGVSPNPYQDTRGRGVSPNPYQDTRGRGVSPNPYQDNYQDNRGRGVSPNPYHDTRGRGVSPNPYHDPSGRGVSPNPHHDMRARGISTSPHPAHRQRGLSPQPPPANTRRGVSPGVHAQHTIKRKSVSPAPPPSDHRRLSGIPFGPDSYNELNPTLSANGSEIAGPDPDEKIITHDGREIDPSDHLPMDTWAPEPEPKGPKTPATASVRSRVSAAPAPQVTPTSGRRQLRIAGRPQSQVSPVTYNSDPYSTAVATTGSGGRNRLQKKTQRMSALPSTSPAGSSPLAPISSHNYQDNGSDFTPPRLPRASTWDYPSENHAPQYGSSPGGMRGGPPIPAKIPLPVMSGAMPASYGGGNQGEWALMQEMSRIDIGAGRSRRHRHY
ncbi:C2 domain containing protein [Colletotrichum plurivorum]|uniref:C2 domain containing protein n=1 Tax=Colletotrichum plurivorum TaxID=2175906 RepID=A0A8H6JZF6_9PEZI|nr:C2 domain containing protein [Colletotrichum plurivorum]